MFLNKINLENIRSYVNQEIVFPKGTTLLSGDIGSGKSSILLAIEFVLFGLKKGKGAGLLRNGTDKGFIELDFELNGVNNIIRRNLVRKKDKIVQGSGSLNGKELSATELKQRILNLLNYPPEMLTKDSLIYRYTVYTPQEEMKFILLGDKDSRLDTLRKVFGIDKYKVIKENSVVFCSYLREKIKELEGRIFDLDEKKKELEIKKKELDLLNEKFEEIKPEFDKINNAVEYYKNHIVSLELSVKSLNNFKKEFEICKAKLEQNIKMVEENNRKLSEIKIIKIDEEKIKVLDEEVNGFKSLFSALQTKIINSEDIKKKIIGLDKCPTCEQDVSEEYKNRVKWREEDNIKGLTIKLNECKKNLELKEKELNEIRKIDSENRINLVLKDALSKKNAWFASENEELEKEVNQYAEEIKRLGGKEAEYELKKKELDVLIEKRRSIETEKIKIESDVKNLSDIVSVFKREIKEKLECKKEKEKWSKIHFFVKEQFLSMMSEMEKNVMYKVHGEFNSLFMKWFGMIISSDFLDVCLDEEFSPIIFQNGHYTDYGFLSGGEKTAIALAYRLALNQVINSLMSSIKTKDLLILDEPTDGFSSEQLDKVRDVLDELNIGQIIMVSHDSKVESFVENVLRLEKKEHVSFVI